MPDAEKAAEPAATPDPLAPARDALAAEQKRQRDSLDAARQACAAEIDAVLARRGFRIAVVQRPVDAGALGIAVQAFYTLDVVP